MADQLRHLAHLHVVDRAKNESFHRRGGGNAIIREVEYRAHGKAIRGQLDGAFTATDQGRTDANLAIAELRTLGSIITLEGASAAFPLKLDTLHRVTRGGTKTPSTPRWLLLSVHPASNTQPERAIVWVADTARAQFLKLFEDYLEKKSTKGAKENWDTPEGNPANRQLVANIAAIRHTVLHDLWQSVGEPPTQGLQWWELWLEPAEGTIETAREFLTALGWDVLDQSLTFNDRVVMWVRATWSQLDVLPFTAIPVAEVRRPTFIDSIHDLEQAEQDDYVEDLAGRLIPADINAPAVTHLDTGVLRTHRLLHASLDSADLHTVIGTIATDRTGHGTAMAGLALLGPMDELLTGTGSVQLQHRLESVRVLPHYGESDTDPQDYGTVTADAVARVELTRARARAFCMPLSTRPDKPGQPTLWSATVDALAVGSDIVRDGDNLQLLSSPNADATRLVVIAAGNVDQYSADYRDNSDTSAVADPAQAWNALTVGAYTDLTSTPADLDYAGWSVQAQAGELSPHSRTSLLFGKRPWPIKPDVCFEGGNVLTDGQGTFETRHPVTSLRSTGIANDLAVTSANATSAAAAQAARLSALTMAQYPDYWAETVRGLIVHAAEWTDTMRAEIDAVGQAREKKLMLLRQFGWGVPTEDAVLRSSRQTVTMVVQDTFVPFEGTEYAMRHFRLHDLPWPTEVLEQIGAGVVTLKVTLSYFVEPSASRRGWRQRYTYPSHALRFELKAPTDLNEAEFVSRLNREAEHDEDATGTTTADPTPATTRASGAEHWLIGAQQRDLGSLHQDIWQGTGQELAACGLIGIYPVGGWWKRNKRKDRLELPVRYSLILSLHTSDENIDLYSAVETQLDLPIDIDGT